MNRTGIVRLVALVVGIHCLTNLAWANKREVRLPLHGCKGHFELRGEARSTETWAETNRKDHKELVIEVRNIPLRPGTLLVVFVGDESIGNITVDARQRGYLKITSEQQKYVPMLDWGTSVMLTKVDGSIISY